MSNQPEPWLRGPLADIHPVLGPVLRSLEQAREDLARHTEALTTEQIWARPHGSGSVGFNIRHIIGSVDRLTAYLEGRGLTEDQMSALRNENEPGATREALLVDLEAGLRDVSKLGEARTVGRQHLPTTVIGLLIHIAEHTQRHVGQAISACRYTAARRLEPTIPDRW